MNPFSCFAFNVGLMGWRIANHTLAARGCALDEVGVAKSRLSPKSLFSSSISIPVEVCRLTKVLNAPCHILPCLIRVLFLEVGIL